MRGDRALSHDELAAIAEFAEGRPEILLQALGSVDGRTISLIRLGNGNPAKGELVLQRLLAKLDKRNRQERRNIKILRDEHGFLTEKPNHAV